MLTAVWTVLGILKIAGFILLGILGFLLAGLLLLLFVPVRYQAAGSFYNKPVGRAKVSWLFPVLSIKAVYEEKLVLAVRVVGIRIFSMEKVFGKKDGTKEESGKESGESQIRNEKSEDHFAGEAKSHEGDSLGGEFFSWEETDSDQGDNFKPKQSSTGMTEKEDSQKPEPLHSEKLKQTKKKNFKNKTSTKKHKKSKQRKQKFSLKKFLVSWKEKLLGIKKQFIGKLQKIKNQWKEKLQRMKDRFMQLENKKEKLKEFWNDPANRHTLHLLKRQTIALIKHILPRKISGRVRFGMEDPYTMGQVLTLISPFYGFYAKKVEVIPVFGEKVIEGEGEIKGRIRIGTLLWIGLRMLFDKNFRKLLKKYL